MAWSLALRALDNGRVQVGTGEVQGEAQCEVQGVSKSESERQKATLPARRGQRGEDDRHQDLDPYHASTPQYALEVDGSLDNPQI